MEVTISVSPDIEHAVRSRAAAEGKNIKEFLESLVAANVSRPSLDEMLAPVRLEFAELGMSETEFDTFVKQERRAMWEEKAGK